MWEQQVKKFNCQLSMVILSLISLKLLSFPKLFSLHASDAAPLVIVREWSELTRGEGRERSKKQRSKKMTLRQHWLILV